MLRHLRQPPAFPLPRIRSRGILEFSSGENGNECIWRCHSIWIFKARLEFNWLEDNEKKVTQSALQCKTVLKLLLDTHGPRGLFYACRYIIFDARQIRFNLIRVVGVERHAILNMHNLWASLEFYYPYSLYFRNVLCYIINNLFAFEKTFARTWCSQAKKKMLNKVIGVLFMLYLSVERARADKKKFRVGWLITKSWKFCWDN